MRRISSGQGEDHQNYTSSDEDEEESEEEESDEEESDDSADDARPEKKPKKMFEAVDSESFSMFKKNEDDDADNT